MDSVVSQANKESPNNVTPTGRRQRLYPIDENKRMMVTAYRFYRLLAGAKQRG